MPENRKLKAKKKEISPLATAGLWKNFKIEAILVALIFLLGILSGRRFGKLFIGERIPFQPVSIWKFLFWFAAGSLIVLWIVYFIKSAKGKKIFFKGIFLLSAVFGTLFFFSLWFDAIFSIFLVFFLVFLWLKKRTVLFHDLFLIFAIIGISARMGAEFSPGTIILVMLIFSVHDYIAVYKTKHMVKMAKEMVEGGAILGIIIPRKVSDFKASLIDARPGQDKFMILGAGDIVFPLILAVSFLPAGLFPAFVSALFSFLGFSFGSFIFIRQKERKPMPGLPAIAVFSGIGYLVIKLAFWLFLN